MEERDVRGSTVNVEKSWVQVPQNRYTGSSFRSDTLYAAQCLATEYYSLKKWFHAKTGVRRTFKLKIKDSQLCSNYD